jgi:hypothetical protein
VFFGEGNYEFGPGWMGETVTPNTLRRQGWWAMTSGAFGQMWGTRPTTNFSSGWQAQLGTTGVVEYGYWRSFWQAVNWTSVVPDQANSFLTSGEGAYSASGLLANSNYSTATLSPDGSLGVVYIPAATTVTLDLSKMRGTVTAQWFDPTTGVYSSAGTWPNSGTHGFAASGTHADGASDWILLLKA